MRALLAALLVFTASLSLGQTLGSSSAQLLGGDAAPEFLPVEEAYQLEIAIEDTQNVRLYWQIADSYYLYKHAFKFKLEIDGSPASVSADFPPALERNDEYFGDVSVYYNNADVQLLSQQPLEKPAQLAITFQGCADAGLCYPPKTQHFALTPSGTVTEIAAPHCAQKGSRSPRAANGPGLPAVHAAAGLFGRRYSQPDALRIPDFVPEGTQLRPQHRSRSPPA